MRDFDLDDDIIKVVPGLAAGFFAKNAVRRLLARVERLIVPNFMFLFSPRLLRRQECLRSTFNGKKQMPPKRSP